MLVLQTGMHHPCPSRLGYRPGFIPGATGGCRQDHDGRCRPACAVAKELTIVDFKTGDLNGPSWYAAHVAGTAGLGS
ncbi:hypothetical protein GCM10010412_085170 [Nonomuraea recticatena]|uniref:Uncharacterized protein n=1 Tax=Nonomuraea recticatena TaxID=46178 RepID=A0ABN3T5H7_9ACTN